jgi:ribosomal protein L3 glutamine methyltransferase
VLAKGLGAALFLLDHFVHGSPASFLLFGLTDGSLAVLTAMAWETVAVDAADLSADALAVARMNVDRHGLGARIALHQGDGLAAVAGRSFDLIVCNPPYVDADAMAALPPEFRAEPVLALAGGADGMDFIRGLLAQAPAHMTPDAVLVLEIGNERAHFEAAFPALEVVWLPTQAMDDGVLLVTRSAIAAPGALASGRTSAPPRNRKDGS